MYSGCFLRRFSAWSIRAVAACILVGFPGTSALADAPGEQKEKLLDACRRSDLEGVQKLLKENTFEFSADADTEPTTTALHLAVRGRASKVKERRQIVALLLEAGADPNGPDANFETPLQQACRKGWDREVIDLLIRKGGDVNRIGDRRAFHSWIHAGGPLHRAVAERDRELVELLLDDYGADPNLVYGRHRDSVMIRLFGGSKIKTEAIAFNKTEEDLTTAFVILKRLLEAGAKADYANREGETALHHAARANHFLAVKELVFRGADPSARSEDRSSALHFAARYLHRHDRKVFEHLLRKHPEILNSPDSEGNTPLHEAIRRVNDAAVESLLLLGAEVSGKNKEGMPAHQLSEIGHLKPETRNLLARFAPAPAPGKVPAGPRKIRIATADAGDGSLDLPRQQGSINGLVVHTLKNGARAGAARRLIVTAKAGEKPTESWVSFGQNAGWMMHESLEEGVRFLQTRHQWPGGWEFEISFEEKFIGHEGPSATLALTLMLDSLRAGYEIDQEVAVTGDLSADGTVRSIGGVAEKIRSVREKGLRIAIIPSGNRPQIEDLAALGNWDLLRSLQVVNVDSFDAAEPVAKTRRAAAIQKAMTSFETVPKDWQDLGEADSSALLEKLRTILDVVPGHLSAELISRKLKGTGPEQLSLAGSIELLDGYARAFVRSARTDSAAEAEAELKTELERLGKQAPWSSIVGLLPDETKPYGKELERAMADLQTRKTEPADAENIQKRTRSITKAREKLMNDPALMERLLKRFSRTIFDL